DVRENEGLGQSEQQLAGVAQRKRPEPAGQAPRAGRSVVRVMQPERGALDVGPEERVAPAIPDDTFTQRAPRIDEERGGHVAVLSLGWLSLCRGSFFNAGAFSTRLGPTPRRSQALHLLDRNSVCCVRSAGLQACPQALPLYNVSRCSIFSGPFRAACVGRSSAGHRRRIVS